MYCMASSDQPFSYMSKKQSSWGILSSYSKHTFYKIARICSSAWRNTTMPSITCNKKCQNKFITDHKTLRTFKSSCDEVSLGAEDLLNCLYPHMMWQTANIFTENLVCCLFIHDHWPISRNIDWIIAFDRFLRNQIGRRHLQL